MQMHSQLAKRLGNVELDARAGRLQKSWMCPPDDTEGPTKERMEHAGIFKTDVGLGAARRVTMLDDALGRAWRRQKISAEEYSALRCYALHWLAGGLQGALSSVDLNRILAFNPAAMSGLAKTEAMLDHKNLYYAARKQIGFRPSFVADQVACFGHSLTETGEALGFQSAARGRERAAEILSDAGGRLAVFWKDHH